MGDRNLLKINPAKVQDFLLMGTKIKKMMYFRINFYTLKI